MVIASPRSTHRGMAPVPTEMDDDREHRKMIAQATLQLQERARNLPIGVTSVSAAYTMIDTDGLILVNASGGAITVTLLSAAGRTGREITVKKTDSSSNAVTIDAAGSETLDGSTTVTLTQQTDSRSYQSDGTNWRLVAVTGVSASSGTSGALAIEILADSPTGYWKCDDSGSTLVDSSGNGYDMTVVSTPTMQNSYLVPTDNTKYMRISGNHGGTITSALGTSPPLSGDWTVGAIVALENAAVNNFTVFTLGDFSSATEALNMQIYCYRRTANNGGPAVLWENGTGPPTSVTTNWPFTSLGLPLFKPVFLHWVKDGTANTVTFYVGGMKQATGVSYGGTEPTGGTGSIMAKIGFDGTSNQNNGSIGHVFFKNGSKLSDARIWAHARAAGLAGFVAAI